MAACQNTYGINSTIGVGSAEKGQLMFSKSMAYSNEYGWGAAAPHPPANHEWLRPSNSPGEALKIYAVPS
eukprot:3584746-Heterocapsa_arctica.AAC.1